MNKPTVPYEIARTVRAARRMLAAGRHKQAAKLCKDATLSVRARDLEITRAYSQELEALVDQLRQVKAITYELKQVVTCSEKPTSKT